MIESETRQVPVGELLRQWRQVRRLSQLELSLDSEVSTRHLSFIETGRSQPSREMILRLAEQLNVPLRERNQLLVRGGFAPVYPEAPIDDPSREAARQAIDLVLTGHEPSPAIAIDRHWNLIRSNRTAPIMLERVPAEMLTPPVNVLRLSLHPDGLIGSVVDPEQWRGHVFALLRRQIERTADPVLIDLFKELQSYPVGNGMDSGEAWHVDELAGGLIVPLRIRSSLGVLSFFSTTTVFGTASDVNLSELAIETFFPADTATARALRQIPLAATEESDLVP